MTAPLATAGLLVPQRDSRTRLGVAVHRQARWLVTHRFLRTFAQLQARKGAPVARLLVDPAARLDPYPLHEQIRARGRLVPTPMLATTTDHALVAGILRDPHFGVAIGQDPSMPRLVRWAIQAPDPNVANVIDAPSLLAVNPPDHTRYRRLVSKPFTPRALQAVADRVEERASQLLDGLVGRQEVDIVGEYAALLPVAVIAEILGVPEDAHAQLLAWGHAIAPVLDQGLTHRTYTASERALRQINAWFDGHFAALRRAPGDDILSHLVNADPGDRLTDRELRATALLLLGAGFETTVNLLGNAIAQIAGDEPARARLAADPTLWVQATDEMLRLESPVQVTARVALADREIDGIPITKGSAVLMLLGAANRDPDVFPDPARFDLDRPNSREHVAFSGGIHFCLGASLARMEGSTGLRMLFERFPSLTLAGPGTRRDLQTLRGYETLPIRLT
jgi:cytochrome P450